MALAIRPCVCGNASHCSCNPHRFIRIGADVENMTDGFKRLSEAAQSGMLSINEARNILGVNYDGHSPLELEKKKYLLDLHNAPDAGIFIKNYVLKELTKDLQGAQEPAKIAPVEEKVGRRFREEEE